MKRAAVAALLVGVVAFAAAASSHIVAEPLEPEKAFRLSARPAPDREAIVLHFSIEEGYYLYRDRFKVEAANLPVGTVVLPDGIEKDDPFVGRARILTRSAALRLPLTASVKPGTYRLKVTAQGCAEERVCYAPFTQTVTVRWPG